MYDDEREVPLKFVRLYSKIGLFYQKRHSLKLV